MGTVNLRVATMELSGHVGGICFSGLLWPDISLNGVQFSIDITPG